MTGTIEILQSSDPDFQKQFDQICGRNPVDADDLQVVEEVLAQIRARGSEAVLEYSAHFDHTDYSSLEDAISVPDESWTQGVSQPVLDALEVAKSRIERFHQAQKPTGFSYQDEHGNTMGSRWLPVQRVGLYVPGGKAAYPSSVLMNTVPAKVAGVRSIVMTTPPGFMKPEVRAAAWIAGVDAVVSIGGIQAIGLLSYGAEGFAPVDTIVGPGNRYVAAAKRAVYGRVSIDMIAGPSEILVLADGSVDPEWVAADMLSQAEHDETAVCGLIATDALYAQQVCQSLYEQARATARSAIALKSLESAFAVVAKDAAQMIQLSNQYAPEHLELAMAAPQSVLEQCTEAGSVFVGQWCPEAVGDYIAGPNHVLPTSGSARFFSPLGVDTFMKRSAFTEFTHEGLKAYGDAIIELAECEELSAHAQSVRIRLQGE